MFNVLARVQWDFVFIYLFVAYGFLVLLGLLAKKAPSLGIVVSFMLPWVTFFLLITETLEDALGDIGSILMFVLSIVFMVVGIFYCDSIKRIRKLEEQIIRRSEE